MSKTATSALVAGLVIGAGVTVTMSGAMTGGARESLALQIGDTAVWHASVQSDSIVRPIAGVGFVCLRPGQSFAFERFYIGRTSQQLAADTITVSCVEPIDTTVTVSRSLYTDFWTDSTGMVRGVEGVRMAPGETKCVFAVALDALGRARTGLAVDSLRVSDTRIARVNDAAGALPRGLTWPQVCPDTTIDILKLQWSVKPPPTARAA